MAGITGYSKVALLLLCGWGVLAVGIFSFKNGLFPTLEKLPETGFLPGTEAPLRISYTGLKALDAQLTGQVSFFWAVIHGDYPEVCLHSVDFLGQGVAAWVVCVVEGSRQGNKGKFVSYIATMGLFIQNISFAVTMPAYLALHLFTSPTVSGSDPRLLASQNQTLKLIPLSIILGYLVPAILMSLPVPSVISFDQKQIITAIFQPFPVIVSAVQWVAETLLASTPDGPLSDRSKRTQYQTALRRVYAFGFACSAVGHIASWTLSLTAALYPQIFAPTFASSLHPARVFMNASPLSSVKISSLGEGVLWFLQWDLFTGSAALLIWAFTLHVNARSAQGKGVNLVGTLFKAVLMTVLAGPCGAALGLIWERDEMALEDASGVEKKGL